MKRTVPVGSSSVTVRDVWGALDADFPFAHRADWDNVGILLGDPAARGRGADSTEGRPPAPTEEDLLVPPAAAEAW